MHVVFNGLPAPTIGVELELQILDADTKGLVSGASRILEHAGDDPHVKPELIQSTIEVNTAVCAEVAEVRRDLAGRIGTLVPTCEALRRRLKFACLFISHDLAVVCRVADRIAVMFQGQVVEEATPDRLVHQPEHPYTRALIRAARRRL
jgi:hypothetical protein